MILVATSFFFLDAINCIDVDTPVFKGKFSSVNFSDIMSMCKVVL